ncbi:MAG: hypothetical protein ACI8P9_003028 [Parasphingorhabdus sp.]
MFGFVHIQKTAGQTIREILRKNFGAKHCDIYRGFDTVTLTNKEWKWISQCYPNLQSIGGHNIVPRGKYLELKDIQFFTFLRDPVARSISHYQFLVKRKTVSVPFSEWMPNNANRQVKVLSGELNLQEAIDCLETQIGFTGMMESFNESLVLWKHWIDLPNFDIRYQSVNVAKSNSLREKILADSANQELLDNYNSLDQRLYNYAKLNIWPRQIEWLGDQLNSQTKFLEESLDSASNFSARNFYGRVKRNMVFRPRFKKMIKFQDS